MLELIQEILNHLERNFEEEEFGSREIAVYVGHKLGVQNPENFADIVPTLLELNDQLDFAEILEHAYEISKVYEAAL